ncbi:hypothetical protein OROMI_023086 [Orobanche minor]
MAANGIFDIQLEFKRFLERVPNLNPKFCNLLQKGLKNIKEEEVVSAVSELLLHPKYTIPLLGCFRPIAQEIVNKTVKLLLVVLNSWSNDDHEEFEEDNFLKEGETSIFDIYDIRRGKFLRLHELACLAFSQALDLIPSLSGSILNYLEVAPAPFERIKRCESVPRALATGPNQLLNVIRASYLFLILEPEVLTTKWNWSCFLDILNQSKDLTLINTAEMREIVSDMRWCSVEILSVVLNSSFKASADLGLDPDNAFQSFLRWKEFRMGVSLEKGIWYLESCAEERELVVDDNAILEEGSRVKRCRLSSSPVQEIMPSYQLDKPITWNSRNPFVLTSTITKSCEMATLAVSQRWPVLLYGPAGAGKTALIHKLALNHCSKIVVGKSMAFMVVVNHTQKPCHMDFIAKVLSIHMDEQVDGKTLIGSHVSTEQPGEFRWQPGSLTQAVLNGFWVVLEDIDKAPPDILSMLHLLDGAPTFLTGHGEAIRVNEGFRLFSTMTSSNSDITRFTGGRNSLGSLGAIWRKVMIGPPSKEDLLNIVLAWYPELKPLAKKLIETFGSVNQLIRFQLGLTTPSGYNDRFTLRDLLKLCKRVSSLGFSFDQGLSSYTCTSIYKEAIDVFASFSTSAANRLVIMKEIGKTWSISAVDTLYPVNKPIIQESHSGFQVGRVSLQRAEVTFNPEQKPKPFVQLRSSVHALERIACSVKFNEPVLLVGETGTGKTTLVQTIATRLGQKLTVLNLSQQSDVVDLLGGFKPLDAQFVCVPLYVEFENLFTNTFSSKGNIEFLGRLRELSRDKNWKLLLGGFQRAVMKMVEIGKSSPGTKRKRPLSEQLLKSWANFSVKLEKAHAQVSASNGMVFSFVEGAFVTALRNGEWVLLDEVNLAPPEILQRVIGVLEDENGSLCLSERGDIDYVSRHPNFRLFACMNPATDAGKRDMQFSLRSRFTEYFIDDVLDDEDLVLFIKQFFDHVSFNGKLSSKIVQFYKAAKESEERLQDGANQKPHYSLRSLYRALEYLKLAKRRVGFEKDLYDGFCMFFQNLLDNTSAKVMNNLICKHLLEEKMPPQLPVQEPDNLSSSYILTKSVKKHLENLGRAISVGRYPVLLQGPTSSGKTSLVRFLAAKTGRDFVRINNHEHTDLQEYLGSYITDATGKLVFQEGALVKAVRSGHWIVLDELNLAPSDVLEALNRLLDDNRELFVPELRETIRAHPKFMLFATQNPPVVYGGRKILSRAFRNRFVEIHVEEIPQEELSTILENRCKIPGSYAKKMVDVMKELQLHRQSSKIFAGKDGFITPRDLFRWADRFRILKCNKSYEDLARDGYYLLAERLRDDAERRIVKEVLESKLRVKLLEDDMYKQDSDWKKKKHLIDEETIGKIIWTESMRRMYFLVNRCYEMREPVLLVGETGGGKTTICQLLSIMLGSKLHILNCHQHTETSDFIGGFYPVRDRLKIIEDFKNLCYLVKDSKAFKDFSGDKNIIMDINQASQTIDVLSEIIKSYREHSISHPEVTVSEIDYMENLKVDMRQLHQKWCTIFMWQDGPLIEAMKNGDLLLVDEISLADDSVLERLNSVLEPERKLSLAEKGGSDLEVVSANPNFFILATMNPGGDYGKKELSPALRNRFTEIWVPSVNIMDDLRSIALGRIVNPGLVDVANIMLDFWEWFNHLETSRLLTVRDLLSWVSFTNAMERNLSAESALVHGAFLVLLDGLSLGTGLSESDAAELRLKCLSFLLEKLKEGKRSFDSSSVYGLETYGWEDPGSIYVLGKADDMECDNLFGIHPFYIEKGADRISADGFEFRAPTTRRNALRVLRAMQLNKPVLLEGSPGVGKTSLIENIGKYSGHAVVRINLSEQTDIMDLLGSDFPVESDEGIQFAWSDGILLQALKKGSWVLLDELNLAPQSVLEGLNAVLDHRAEVFVPELDRSFKCPTSFRVFACQNPSHQGGGRKGLPKSFLNRFTKVYVDELGDEDYLSICNSKFPSIERSLLLKLITFNKRLHQETMIYHKFAQDGSPWEFNLRDVYRSCEIIQGAKGNSKFDCFLNTIYIERMRTAGDRVQVMELYEQVFEKKPFINPYPSLELTPHSLSVGDVSIERYRRQSSGKSSNNLKILPGMHLCLEAVAQCVKNQWLCILVGPPSSGKTSLIRSLAELTGNVLHELNLSSTTDISELLGSFEQYYASRHYHIAVAQVGRYVNEYCDLLLEYFPMASKDLITQWLSFLPKNKDSDLSAAIDIDNPIFRDSIPMLVRIIEYLKMENHEHALPVSWSDKDLDSILDRVRKLEENLRSKRHYVKFEWVTGVMVKAIENGGWIVLENANLCNPTVLDRLNSLVEQSGSITINECGTLDGKSMVLHPHPQFRMFFTVNPSFGEVSRAMRNRGVEVYMMQPYWLLEGVESKKLVDFELREVKRFITLSGIPVSKLVDMMAKAHLCARREGFSLDVTITYLELSRWLQLFQQLITNGNQPAWSVQISFEHTYLSSFGEEKGKNVIYRVAASYLSTSELYTFTSPKDRLLCLPGGWPTPLNLKEYVYYCKEACVRKNCMYLESLGSLIASFQNRGRKQETFFGGTKEIHLMDALSLQTVIFPTASIHVIRDQNEEMDLAQKKLCFAADWVIQQASECDCQLYIRWFEWFGLRLQPSVSFLNRFADLLKMCLSYKSSLTTEFTNVNPSVGLLNSCRTLLLNSTHFVGHLRRSFEQWSKEARFNYGAKAKSLEPILTSLRRIEEKVLDLLVELRFVDDLFMTYSDLLEHHILFSRSIESHYKKNSHFQVRPTRSVLGAEAKVFWLFLLKDVTKLQEICPAEVEMFKIVMKDSDNVSSLRLNPIKSLLWKHGGHPIVHSSNGLHEKQRQLSNLCEMLWPRGKKFWKINENKCVDASLSSHVELRYLAMQGLCMSSYISGEPDVNNQNTVQQLEDMYQVLVRRMNFEKQKLETTQLASWSELNSSCCVFNPNTLSKEPGFEFWLKTQPINDETSLFLDLELLQHLTRTVAIDREEQHYALLNQSGLLQSSINFSLSYSSRPPTDFLPHQNIIWILDAWSSVNRANEKITSFIMEMWFRWHETLWDACPMLTETLQDDDASGTLLPTKLFQPLKLAVVDQILQSANSIKDYPLHSFKLRAASRNIWHSSGEMANTHDRLLSVARSLFEQIVFAHKNSFQESEYTEIRSVFMSLKESTNPREYIKILIVRLASSNHNIFKSLIDSYIEPLLTGLYSVCSSDDIWQNMGSLFLRMGCLRYNLLICCDSLDLSEKYSIMYSAITERITSLKIEIEVHEECAYLAGSAHLREPGDKKMMLLEKLEAEKKRLQNKMVFRSGPSKAKDLKHVCDDFLELVTAFGEWINNVRSMQKEATEKVHNWQKTTSRFIDRLSKEYSEYMDIIEPVQIAIYEIKLGLSLIESNVLYKKYLGDEEFNMELFLDTIHNLMRFPRDCGSKTVSFNFRKQPKLSTFDIDLPTGIQYLDINLLQKMIGLKADKISDAKASSLPTKILIYNNVLARIRDSAADACFLGGSSFKHLHEIFSDVANLWMKHRVKQVEESMFKFRARAFNIESIINIDETSDHESLLANGSSEMELEEKSTDELVKADEALEQAWNAQESNLDDIINIHNQLFGSVDLVQLPGRIQVCDKDRLYSFLGSYMLGVELIRDLKGPFSSNFDAKIAPEHLLRLCLEHDHKFILSHRLAGAYNFYKDSNPPMMAKLVEPVTTLKERILFLLKEWDDHPALQAVIDVIDKILDLPLDYPLAKALSRLEFLLDRVRSVQETVAKFPLSDQLKPIFSLVSSWHKLEFETWPALLDEVQSQFDRNAGKLWFPLYSIFHRSCSDAIEYNKSTIESLNELFKTSNIGEFRKQLQLLISFHGHISNDLDRRSDTSPSEWDNVKIIYNTCGFYVQLLPRIMEHISVNRKSIEKKLAELLKLCRWDRFENHFAIENFRRRRIKLKNIIKEYTELLQQPLMEFLGSGTDKQHVKAVPFEVIKTILDIISNQAQYREDSFNWLSDWWKSLENERDAIHVKGDVSFSHSSCLLYLEERKQVWHIIEDICITLVRCSGLWEDTSMKLGKRRALSDLLKLLETLGLKKRRTSVEGRFGKSESWLLQPSYKVQHLLPTQSEHSSGNVNVGFSNLKSSSPEVTWKTATEYYFKSIASVEYLEEICLNFHKDFTLEQVRRSGSYVDHLIEIQQEQRAFAYSFAGQLACLRQCMWPLSNLFSSEKDGSPSTDDCSFMNNQYAIFDCMWQQKRLFDAFCTMLYEENLLLQTVESNHVNTCGSVKLGAEKIRVFIQKFLVEFKNAKLLLDCHLLGNKENITLVGVALHPYGVTNSMEKLLNKNFELVRNFETDLLASFGQDDFERGVTHILLGHFGDLLAKAKIAERLCNSQMNSKAVDGNSDDPKEHMDRLKSGFDAALKETYMHMFATFEQVGSPKYDVSSIEESLQNIKDWEILFKRDRENLQLELICASVMRTVQSAGELINHRESDSSSISLSVCSQLRPLYVLLDKLLVLGDNFMLDFLITHRMVSIVTYVLANIFASLFAKGFGTIEEEQDTTASIETTQDATETGMGEGAGVNDVSDQIENEDQLLGTDKANEEQDTDSEQPSKTNKGIEMEEEFNGEAFSVSEDDESDENVENEVDQDEQLDTAMGEVGEYGEVADEKLGDMDDDTDENNDRNEKYEHGPSVKDNSPKDEELRAKEEDSATVNDDDKDGDAKESTEDNNESGDEDVIDDEEDMNIDKADASAEFSGINPDEQNQIPDEGTDVNEMEADEPTEDVEMEEFNGSDVNNDEDANVTEESSDNITKNEETANGEENLPENDGEKDVGVPKEDLYRPTPDLNNPTLQSGQPNELPDTTELGMSEQENNSSFSDFQTDFAPSKNLPPNDAPELGVKVLDSRSGQTSGNEQSKASYESLIRKPELNPCRSIGDAVEGWKERVNVTADVESQENLPEDIMNEDASEYGYTAEFKDGTAQALGPATAEQTKEDMTQNDNEKDVKKSERKETVFDTEIEKRTSDNVPVSRHSALNSVRNVTKQTEVLDLGNQPEESMEIDVSNDHDLNRLSGSLVSVNRAYMSEGVCELSKSALSDDELVKVNGFDVSNKMRNDAAALWRSYELSTTRLSQELAEQLRLVLEPTLASRLQGDYKTGKRINMKKVIQYIVSQFRKDKIWLRRTRPNKRDYQVIIAVDDSRSMSEGQCGNFAIEALVTVCRAMSQLEVGNFGVVSFGKQGNIRLLHDFDQHITSEAGIQGSICGKIPTYRPALWMISNLTFKQENTILDEPMHELLKYLDNMLDTSVARARLPSGDNPLQQLVLIIADGRFNEKEKLKRRVRDLLNKNCMVAFMLLDSANESILDCQEATLQGKEMKFSKYLDSFPFPYYAVLRNIEALPQTLGDLLRQWFELMQNSR